MFFDVKYEPTFHHIPGRRFSLLDAKVVAQEEANLYFSGSSLILNLFPCLLPQFDRLPGGATIKMQRLFQLQKKKQHPTRHFFIQLVHAEYVACSESSIEKFIS